MIRFACMDRLHIRDRIERTYHEWGEDSKGISSSKMAQWNGFIDSCILSESISPTNILDADLELLVLINKAAC